MDVGGASMLFGVLVVVGVVLLVFVVVRISLGDLGPRSGDQSVSRPVGASSESAMLILEECYARGELSAEDYQERRSVLGERG